MDGRIEAVVAEQDRLVPDTGIAVHGDDPALDAVREQKAVQGQRRNCRRHRRNAGKAGTVRLSWFFCSRKNPGGQLRASADAPQTRERLANFSCKKTVISV